MTTDEIVYILQRPTAAKIDLLVQLRELEQTGDDEDFKHDLKIQLDQMCGIPGFLFCLDGTKQAAVNAAFVRPALTGKVKKTLSKAQRELASIAVKELAELANAQTWDLSRYESWRRQHETCAACLRSGCDVQDCWVDPNGVLRSFFQNNQ